MLPSPDTKRLGLRDYKLSRLHLGSLVLRPGDSLTIPKMALSMGFRTFGVSVHGFDSGRKRYLNGWSWQKRWRGNATTVGVDGLCEVREDVPVL